MRSRLLSIVAVAVSLIAGELQADTIIYDNLSPVGGNVFFNNNNVPDINPSRYLLGEDITSTLALPSNATSWRLDTVDFNLLAHGNGTNAETFTNVMVAVTLLGNITGNSGNELGTSFGNATILGSETFSLGDITTGEDGTVAASAIALDFTNQIDIGAGQNIGITFELFDSVTAPLENRRSDRLSVAYRNAGAGFNNPDVGQTLNSNFRDRDGVVGIIDGTLDDFGFGGGATGAGLRFSLGATAVIPEPTSLTVLGIFGLGFVTRRRR